MTITDYPTKCPFCKGRDLELHVDDGMSTVFYELEDGEMGEEIDVDHDETEEMGEVIFCNKCDKIVYTQEINWIPLD